MKNGDFVKEGWFILVTCLCEIIFQRIFRKKPAVRSCYCYCYCCYVRNSATSADAQKPERIQQKVAALCQYRFFTSDQGT